MLTAEPNVYGCYDPQCLDSTWDHPCPVVPETVVRPGALLSEKQRREIAEAGRDLVAEGSEVTAEGWFSPEDWKTIFSTVPAYPLDLPDDLRRQVAHLAIVVREAAEHLERGRRTGSALDFFMPLSLISGALKRMEDYAP